MGFVFLVAQSDLVNVLNIPLYLTDLV